MPSWAIAGASRGIGLEFVRQLSADTENQVFGIIRGQPSPELSKLACNRANVHIVRADLSDPKDIARAAAEVGRLTGEKLDVLIHNACAMGLEYRFHPPSAFAGKEVELKAEIDECLRVNLLGALYTINSFLPLIRNGDEKKIVYITSPSGDAKFTRACGVTVTVGYSISKAGMNIMMSKYAVELAAEGIKTLALSPGWVDTDGTRDMAPTKEILAMALQAFQKVDPSIKGMLTPEESVRQQLEVIRGLSTEQSGFALSHHGDENWL